MKNVGLVVFKSSNGAKRFTEVCINFDFVWNMDMLICGCLREFLEWRRPRVRSSSFRVRNYCTALHRVVYIIVLLAWPNLKNVANCIPPDLDREDKLIQCERINVEFCEGIGYNSTIRMGDGLANPFTGKESQRETKEELSTFYPLLTTGCHPDLKILLCSVYLPFCPGNINKMVVACRPLCERVMQSCVSYLTRFSYHWPASLNCSRFHETNTVDHLCIDRGGSSPPTTRTPSVTVAPPATRRMTSTSRPSRVPPASSSSTESFVKIRSTRTYCRVLYARNEENYFYVEKVRACALGCSKDGLFTYADKQLMEKWLTGLAYICALACIAAIFVIIFNFKVANFPERAIIFITVSYFFYSVAFIVRIVMGREGLSCEREEGRHYMLLDGSGNISCASVFLLAYCFSMAQSVWWVVLTLTWFLRAGLGWKAERVNAKVAYFHFFAWGVPCAKTVVALVLRKIDVNELSGICYVGGRLENLQALRGFVLGPLFTYLVMGCAFLICGFVGWLMAAFRAARHSCRDQTKLDGRLLPVGLFAVLHSFFSSYILASLFYEYVNKESWYLDAASAGPNFSVFLLRTVLDFGVGISAAMWLLLRHVPLFWTKIRQRFGEHSDMPDGQLEPLRAGNTHFSGDDPRDRPLVGGGTNETSI